MHRRPCRMSQVEIKFNPLQFTHSLVDSLVTSSSAYWWLDHSATFGGLENVWNLIMKYKSLAAQGRPCWITFKIAIQQAISRAWAASSIITTSKAVSCSWRVSAPVRVVKITVESFITSATACCCLWRSSLPRARSSLLISPRDRRSLAFKSLLLSTCVQNILYVNIKVHSHNDHWQPLCRLWIMHACQKVS